MLHEAKAIVLKKIPYGEDDLIVTLLTETGLKMSCFAPKARVSKKRFGTALDLFCVVYICYKEKPGSSLVSLSSAELLFSYQKIRANLSKFALVCFLSELVTEFVPEHMASPEIYSFFIQIMTLFESPQNLEDHFLPLLEHSVLSLTGYKPVLESCVECRDVFSEKENAYFFYGLKGGVVCSSCFSKQDPLSHAKESKGKVFPLSHGVILRLLHETLHQPQSWSGASWKKPEITEARQALEYFLQHIAGKPLKTLTFVSQILAS
ncbi:MAG TPA: DNA repair protein RecO [Deltaproteobacteria bacterium]|nr:MAG: DNA repair protein RecO [Deltaproteobacteria bacterium GWA2_45_12]HBF13068.1 DNA repair protein RecO [Deltaproteobacteria bacterium]